MYEIVNSSYDTHDVAVRDEEGNVTCDCRDARWAKRIAVALDLVDRMKQVAADLERMETLSERK